MNAEHIIGDRTFYMSLGEGNVLWTLRCYYDVVHDNRVVRRDTKVKALGSNFDNAARRANEIAPNCRIPPPHIIQPVTDQQQTYAAFENAKMPIGDRSGHTLRYIRETWPDYHDWMIRTWDTTSYPNSPLSKYINAFRSAHATSK